MSQEDVLAVLIEVADRNSIDVSDEELELLAIDITYGQAQPEGRHALAA